MRTIEVLLPNGSDGDSLVHVRSLHEGWSLLFDAGDPSRLAPRDVLRLEHLLVSHCHVDHFIGFDALVRPRVCREGLLHVHGPEGFLDRVESRLQGYTWNLVEGNQFVIEAHEVGASTVRRARFDSGRGFVRQDGDETRHDGVVHEDARLRIESRALDHHVVSQGWAVQLPPSWSVREERLAGRGLPPGSWLGRLKDEAAAGSDSSRAFVLPDGSSAELGPLIEDLLEHRPGERVAYVTDTVDSARTRRRMVELARDADVFACGAPFLARDAERARLTRHLTAAQAGEMAAEAGARRLLLFHVSDRYQGELAAHADEARAAAKGAVEVEVRRLEQRGARGGGADA